MRHRRWVVVLAVVILAVLPLSYLGLKFAARHPAVKRAVLARILPRADAEVSIGELEIGLASLRFRDTVIDLEGGGSITIPAASLGMSYRRLLVSGFRVEKCLTSALLREPHLSVVLHPGRADSVGEGEPPDLADVAAAIPDYVGVSGGSVTVRDAESGRELSAAGVDLEMLRGDEGSIEGSATGFVGSVPGSLSVDVRWNAGSESLWVGGLLEGYDLSSGLPLPGSPPFVARSGSLDGTLDVRRPAGRGWEISATFDGRDAGIDVPQLGIGLEVTECSGTFDEGVLRVTSAYGAWRDAAWRGTCVVSLRDREIRSAVLSATGLDGGRVAPMVLDRPPEVVGRLDVAAEARGAFEDPVIGLSVRSNLLTVGGVRLESLRASGSAGRDRLVLDDLSFTALGGSMSGRAELSKPPGGSQGWLARVAGSGRAIEVGALGSALGVEAGLSGLADLREAVVTAGPEGLSGESLLEWRGVVAGGARLGSGAGGVIFGDGDVSVALNSPMGYRVSGRLVRAGDASTVDATIELSGLRPDSVLPDTLSRWAPDVAFLGELELRGPLAAAALSGTLRFEGPRAAGSCGVLGTAFLDRGPGLDLALLSDDAVVSGVPLPFEGRATLRDSSLVVSGVRLGSFAEAEAQVGMTGSRELRGGLVVSEAPLAQLLPLVLGEAAPNAPGGLVFASVSLGGTVTQPSATAQLQVWEGSVAEVSDLDAAVVARLEGRTVELPEIVLRYRGAPIVEGSGVAELDGAVEIALAGDGVPGPILGGGENTRFSVDLGVGGETRSPTFDARIHSTAGEFLGVPFDRFDARVTGARGVLSIDPLGLEKERGYRVAASARLPYEALAKGGDDGSITVDVAGDPIGLLASLWDVGKSTRGSGRLTAYLVGGKNGFTVARGSVECRAGLLRPRALFDRVEDVEILAEIADGAVIQGSLEGRIDGRLLRIESARGISREGLVVPPLSIGGVDVGVLSITTDPDGVEASIPGLMLPDEFGHIALSGKSGYPGFAVGGPSERPRLIGVIKYSNMSFTYPFLESEDGGPGDALSDAEWDIDMSAGRNLWYWRPDANLRIERGSALSFRGVPAEHTLCISGRVESTKGTVTYVNNDFEVNEAFVEFPPFCEPPRFYVEATTRVDDGTEITLALNSFEAVFAAAAPGAPLDESAVILASDAPEDRTQSEILTKLEYGMSTEMLAGEEQAALERRRALEVVAAQIGGRVVRPLLSPVEARLRRQLGLDLVRFDIDFVEHFVAQVDQWRAQEGSAEYVPFLANSRITLGKYIAGDWLVSYVGVAETYEEEIGDQRLGLRNELGIEYEVSRNTSLSLRVVYDPSIADWDRRIAIENRYRF